MKLKDLLNEISVTGVTGTFVGGAGDYIDQKFSGAFHPEMNDLRKMLEKQIEGDIEKRMYTDDVTPIADQDFIDLDWKYEYDKNVEKDNSKFKSTSENEMQLVDIEINYDKIIDKTEENKKFINPTNDWKYIYDSKEK
tara:strand:- start:114 stop:527 length:414 start_codon:yes stop_codon:yes gene_type:complete